MPSRARRRQQVNTHFQYFARLPHELQLMIWEFAREGPRLPIRHCFSEEDSGYRAYAAVEVAGRNIVDRLAKQEDNSCVFLPYEKRIRFPGKVHVELPLGKLGTTIFQDYRAFLCEAEECSTRKLCDHKRGAHTCKDTTCKPANWRVRRKWVSPAVVYVDFELDCFCFNYFSGEMGGWFGFLRNPIDKLQLLPKDHWIFSVRELALSARIDTVDGSSWDFDILKRMKLLRRIWLVAPSDILSLLSPSISTYWPPKRYRTVNTLVRKNPFASSRELGHQRKDFLGDYGSGAKNRLKDRLSDCGSKAQVELVIDLAMDWM
ncbi:hypothetical protein F5Y13DRAFT_200372 [Hypoxylon sp. FL1857]|nr:hypothetical protein F5Y13DRAFT_200372 [Hypoxylon sp. FL1857]